MWKNCTTHLITSKNCSVIRKSVVCNHSLKIASIKKEPFSGFWQAKPLVGFSFFFTFESWALSTAVPRFSQLSWPIQSQMAMLYSPILSNINLVVHRITATCRKVKGTNYWSITLLAVDSTYQYLLRTEKQKFIVGLPLIEDLPNFWRKELSLHQSNHCNPNHNCITLNFITKKLFFC